MTYLDGERLLPLMLDLPDGREARFDQDAFVAVLTGHRDHLMGVAVNLLGDRASAEDAVQDAFERILRARPALRDDRAVLGYARTAVLNCCRTALRRRTSALRLLIRHGVDTIAPAADEPLLQREEYAGVLRHFDRLPVRQREVLVLRHYAQLSDAQIASALSISPSTVRSNASRGIAALAALIEGEQP